MSGNYILPTMGEINSVEKKFTVMSTFSGGGGSCLGYKMAGGNVLVANEFIPEAQETYAKNFPETILLKDDIRKLKGSDFLDAVGMKRGELDIFDGSPPCSAFSTAGSREKGWGKTKKYSSTVQRVDDLFFEYARLLSEIKPKTFIAENVKGLTMGMAKGYLKEIVGCLRMVGYDVRLKVINSYNYGVPQSRDRLIIIGVRNDLGLAPSYPMIQKQKYNVRDAFKNVAEGEKVFLHGYSLEKYWGETKIGSNHPKRFSLSRISQFKPCPTITQTMGTDKGKVKYAGNLTHWDECRYLTIPEIKRIQSLPDDFYLSGTFAQQWERVGRMVPPLMMKSVAQALYESVLSRV